MQWPGFGVPSTRTTLHLNLHFCILFLFFGKIVHDGNWTPNNEIALFVWADLLNSKNMCNMEIISAKCKNANLNAGLFSQPIQKYLLLLLKLLHNGQLYTMARPICLKARGSTLFSKSYFCEIKNRDHLSYRLIIWVLPAFDFFFGSTWHCATTVACPFLCFTHSLFSGTARSDSPHSAIM